ncbi:negative regulation of wound healing, partial [Bonamia ostreae]
MSVIDQIIVRRKVNVSRDQLYLLKNVLIVQIYDLRSIVVKEVCKLVNNLSKTIPEQISPFFGAYLNALFSRVYNSIRAIRDPCTDSVRTLVRNIADTRCVKE